MKRLILDASVTLSWCFEGQQTRFSESVLAAVGQGAAPIVPPIWMYEVINVLAAARRKKLMDQATAATFWNKVSKLVAVVENPEKSAAHEILDLAEKYRLTAYDAAYLELALREGLPLATLDKDLKRAARAAGVRLFGCNTSPGAPG
ncbi:MAG: twitching motility protein PilT [Elusimicrobia bacterium]|nr:MAG: twitching motility protein PilT [Elusimicrobiota bacterium]KAF0157801.1 MAG: twitching motility protein PilT [Elusimicrobiota bacterium]